MTHLHHHTAVDITCERIVRPVTDDLLAGHRAGFCGWSAQEKATRFYRRGFWRGRVARYNRWMATFGEGAAD